MELVSFAMGPVGAWVRYGLLERLRSAADARGVRVFGFAVHDRVRLLLDGPSEAVGAVVTATKVGTSRVRGGPGALGPTTRAPVGDPVEALIALHAAPDGPLSDPWTSHRDLLGFRVAPFFDRRVWAGRVDPRLVHAKAGGGDLPRGFPPDLALDLRDVALVLRVAGSVLGVLPADRACFRLFAHTARAVGVRQLDAAAALALSPRRMRQLQREPEPRLPLALTALGDPRLRVVP